MYFTVTDDKLQGLAENYEEIRIISLSIDSFECKSNFLPSASSHQQVSS
jgi:hypothetical protein